MAKRAKGLTFDQKRQKMLNIFHSTKDVYNFQQVQKFSLKAGIALPSIKEVLQSLIADDLVNGDKIGAGNFFWSFPSRTHQILINRVSQTRGKIQKLAENKQKLEKQLQQLQIGREETQQRSELLQRLADLKNKRSLLKKNMQKYERFDPQRVELLCKVVNNSEKQDDEIKKLGNFWTDNIFQIQKYLKKQFQMNDEQIKQRFQIDPEIDYLQ